MREIKFRAKNTSEEWVYGNIICDRDGKPAWLWEFDGDKEFIINSETVCQFTGLMLDGVEVYEHDLIEFPDVLCEVVYNDNLGTFTLIEVLTQNKGYAPLGHLLSRIPCKHKGNIFDDIDKVKLK